MCELRRQPESQRRLNRQDYSWYSSFLQATKKSVVLFAIFIFSGVS